MIFLTLQSKIYTILSVNFQLKNDYFTIEAVVLNFKLLFLRYSKKSNPPILE